MEFEVKQLIETVNTIHDEMFYLRDRLIKFLLLFFLYYRLQYELVDVFCFCLREEEMQNLNRATISKMAWLSFLSLFVCLGVAGMQFMHLKTFLEKKKVI